MTNSIELRVSGPVHGQSLHYRIDEGQSYRIGRAPLQGWEVPWDRAISREHLDLELQHGQLAVRCLAEARNPIIHKGGKHRSLLIQNGDHFQIGETVFQLSLFDPRDAGRTDEPEFGGDTVVWDDNELATQVLVERAYSAADLQRVGFTNAEKQIEILAGLPELISASQSDEELAVTLVELLLKAIPQAVAVAVVNYEDLPASPEQLDSATGPTLMRVATREHFAGRFRPSRRLIIKSLRAQESVIKIWSESEEAKSEYTINEGLSWALAAPIRGSACRGWCLYVSGQGFRGGALVASEEDLQGDLRFTELVAQFIGSVRQVRTLQEHTTQLSAFFSPKVIESLVRGAAPQAMEPAERETTILFCDLRGFSRKSEQLQEDLLRLLRSVQAALGIMAAGILDLDGAIADFQGDAAMGFWGWPVPSDDGPLPACLAALEIHRAFREANERGDELLGEFTVGLGIAHGRALAGHVGTAKQAKIGVFGPVVNKAARLEGMTKQFGLPICMDAATAQSADRLLPPEAGRLRRLGLFCPHGMNSPVQVFGLVPPGEPAMDLSTEDLAGYAAAVDAVSDGRWSEARAQLNQLPPTDGPVRFLQQFLAEQPEAPPAEWTGAIPLTRK